jgi:hypothetical protein
MVLLGKLAGTRGTTNSHSALLAEAHRQQQGLDARACMLTLESLVHWDQR